MTAPTTLAVPRLLAPGGRWTGPATLVLEGGRIAAIHDGIQPGAPALAGGVLTAGLIDLHNNGAFATDFAAADPAEWRRVRHDLARRGVTAVQPTVITAPLSDLLAALGRIAAAMDDADADADAPGAAPACRILGAHLEGPFIAPARRGAHRADWIQTPAPTTLDALLAHPAHRTLRTITLAPEQPGGMDAVRRLARHGIVVALGHSDATAAEAATAAAAGATMVTHLFNAMSPLNHRAPGLPGAALADPRLHVGLIVDGQHVDPLACRLAYAAAPDRIVAVTDSILAAGLPPGTRMAFGGLPIEVDATGLCRRPDGTIAGAGIVLDEGVRRMIAAGVDPALVLRSATETPAAALARPDLGRLAPGCHADLVWWDADWVPSRVWIGGSELTDAR